MIKVVYIGIKEVKGDNVAQTGLIWTPGQIHEVEDEAKALKLLAHHLIWRDASNPYELMKAPTLVEPEPRVHVMPDNKPEDSPYFDPHVIRVSPEEFKRLHNGELVMVAMTTGDQDNYNAWRDLEAEQAAAMAPANTGPKTQERETKAGLDSTLHVKKRA